MTALLTRRSVVGRAIAIGSTSLLTACNFDDLQHPDLADRVLRVMSGWNDRVQAALFDPTRLAPTYPASAITRPPRFNAYYDLNDVRIVDGNAWRLELFGAISEKRP